MYYVSTWLYQKQFNDNRNGSRRVKVGGGMDTKAVSYITHPKSRAASFLVCLKVSMTGKGFKHARCSKCIVQ